MQVIINNKSEPLSHIFLQLQACQWVGSHRLSARGLWMWLSLWSVLHTHSEACVAHLMMLAGLPSWWALHPRRLSVSGQVPQSRELQGQLQRVDCSRHASWEVGLPDLLPTRILSEMDSWELTWNLNKFLLNLRYKFLCMSSLPNCPTLSTSARYHWSCSAARRPQRTARTLLINNLS